MDDVEPIECGTYAGYNRHYRINDLPPCMPCSAANVAYNGQWRVRAGRTKSTLVPYALLGVLFSSAPTALQDWATDQLGDVVVARAIAAANSGGDS